MTNETPRLDTYSALEFQGYVVDCPTYDREHKVLHFKAKSLNCPPLLFQAKGEVAKGFKSLLHQGCLIQATAIPKHNLGDVEGRKYILIRWEVKRLAILGRKKVNLGNFTDRRILDGLMPIDGEEILDVGYVEPINLGR